MNERTKLIIVAVLAFSLGGLLKGGGASNGRYQACGNSTAYVFDTQKGVAWEIRNGRYEKVASMPW
jgi:hypothetical protein